MKIGILTFHRSYNYGAFMQCYSLLNRLKRDFPQVELEVADYTSQRVLDYYAKNNGQLGNGLKTLIVQRDNAFGACQQQLPLSSPKLVSDDINAASEYLNERYDAVIVGSDAVWNWNTRGFPNVYFLKDYHGEKFSYAASAHGLSFQDATPEQRDYLEESFSDFRYIGVRDCTTEQMVHSVLPDAAVYHNCDPTVLLDMDSVPCDMEQLRQKLTRQGVDFSKPLIGLMAGESIGAAVKRHYGNSVQLIALYAPNRYADVFLNDLTPFEWARVFSFFRLTLTHFFHGTLLSLKNGTPVIPIETVNSFSARNVTKIQDLMTRLDLLQWREVIDHRNRGLLWRAANRLLSCSDSALWKRVIQRADELMQSDMRQMLAGKLQTEAEAYRSFAAALSDNLQNKKEE